MFATATHFLEHCSLSQTFVLTRALAHWVTQLLHNDWSSAVCTQTKVIPYHLDILQVFNQCVTPGLPWSSTLSLSIFWKLVSAYLEILLLSNLPTSLFSLISFCQHLSSNTRRFLLWSAVTSATVSPQAEINMSLAMHAIPQSPDRALCIFARNI